MALIAPTVESIGDEALTNSIIDRSITELQDNLVTDLGRYALIGCTALNKVVFGAVNVCDDYAISGCTVLEVADFHQNVSIDNSAFTNCPGLRAVILRSDTLCSLSNTSAFTSSGIATGTGYIYVPAALVDSYKTATNWSTYASQIRAIEDYPEVCDPYSWEVVAKTIENGTYKDVYKIGDCVPLDLGSEGIINMQIAAFDVDTLADGSGTAAISWVGKELLTTPYEWGADSLTSWGNSSLRPYLQSIVKELIPEAVSSMIKSVSKRHINGGYSSYETTTDDVWVPCRDEVYVVNSKYKDLYPDDTSRKKALVGTTKFHDWWLRDRTSSTSVLKIGPFGSTVSTSSTTSASGICLGFCTGKSK